MVLRWIGVRELMTSLILAWGAAQLGMGFVKNWQQLLITRLLLGIFGAPFNGVILFLVSSWYLRHEFQKRLAALAIVITLGTSFSPLLAYGLSLLDGKGGLEGWRWIFIVEGILTVVLGVLTFFFIPGFPDENKFLNAEQTAFVIKRINEDRGDALPDAITVRQVAVHLRDWTLWAYGIIALCSSMSGTVVVYFLPIILTGMGYDLKGTLLRAAAVAISGIPVACLLAYLADKLKHRGSFIIILALISTTGCVLTAWHPKAKIRFFGTFLINLGGLSAAPTIIAYGANNVVSHSKRAVQSALFMTMVSAGGIVGATVFRNQDRPTYVPGLIAVLLSQLLVVTLSGLLMIRHAYWNRRALEGKLDKPLEGQPGFLYTL
ncbi:high-affinity nicotinic acid transporter [Coprinopsis cinerea AmutBmut pab1-1]|nr:high-affinity nicotinic acid transporter [Coprinopsis cinerea AmutBmut pab1-1]